MIMTSYNMKRSLSNCFVIFLITAVDCGPLSNPDNGQVDTSSGTTFTNVAIYSCDTGYILTGSETQMCGSDRMWTPVAPTCVRK